jgi:hypothetical protein
VEISSIANFATRLSLNKTSEAVELAVLKKAIDIQAEGALALIEALPQATPGSNLPANLGQHIDVVV